ncbi:MAG: cobalt transporter CbiM [Rhodospirillales bacterium]
MAHIPDGVLSAPVLIGGAVAAGVIVAAGLRRLDDDRIPKVAVLSAAFFVVALVSVPVGPTSVHLLLNGLMGLILGSAAAPAILVALTLQAAFFGFGGFTALGVNTLNIALPALVVGALLAPRLRRARSARDAAVIGALAGLLATALTATLVVLGVAISGAEYVPALGLVAASCLPLMVGEAAVTAATVGFVVRVKPELLRPTRPAHG